MKYDEMTAQDRVDERRASDLTDRASEPSRHAGALMHAVPNEVMAKERRAAIGCGGLVKATSPREPTFGR